MATIKNRHDSRASSQPIACVFGGRKEPPSTSILKSEAYLESYLVMADLAVLNMPASLDDLEPVQVSDCLAGLRNCRADRFFDTCLGRTYNFNYLVNVIFHFFVLMIV
jgi:hypothetical protein